MDLSGWSRADVLAMLSLLISAVALLVSLIAALATSWQARIAYLAHQHDLDSEEPIVNWRPIVPFDHWPGWYQLKITMSNRSSREIVLESVRFRSCRFEVMREYDATTKYGIITILDTPPKASNTVDIGLRLAPIGTASTQLYGPTRTAELLVYWRNATIFSRLATAARKSPDTARIFLAVSFKDEKTRKKVIPITIELPQKSAANPPATSH
jgi:hypothetical protein